MIRRRARHGEERIDRDRAGLVSNRRSQVQEHASARHLGRGVADQPSQRPGQVRLVVVPRIVTTSAIARAGAQRRARPRPLDHPQRAPREADGPQEPALRRPSGTPRTAPRATALRSAGRRRAGRHAPDGRRRRRRSAASASPSPDRPGGSGRRAASAARVLEVREPSGREHRQVRAEPEIDAEVLRVARARQRRRLVSGPRGARSSCRRTREPDPRAIEAIELKSVGLSHLPTQTRPSGPTGPLTTR